MVSVLKKIWNFDFGKADYRYVRPWVYAGMLFLLFFGVYDMLQDTGSGFYRTLTGYIAQSNHPFTAYLSPSAFAYTCYTIIGAMMVYITVFGLLSFYLSEKKYGKQFFHRIFISHLLSNLVAMVVSGLFFAAVGGLLYLIGFFSYEEGKGYIGLLYNQLHQFIQSHIPTVAPLPRPLAVVAAMIMGSLPGYLHHWLAHQSRFMWYLNHRTHHTAVIMHPAGIGPFEFLSDFFSKIPSVIAGAICGKLFYSEPLLIDITIVSMLGVLTEKFNHTTVFYDFAYRFAPVRWLSAYFGNGVYHYMHHSAIAGDEVVNVGGSPFLFWDRVFGTYKTPYAERPPVGLTNQPDIILSPFAITLSGWQQLGYELWHNKSWWVRFKIIFGSIWYMPPVTKDFLKIKSN